MKIEKIHIDGFGVFHDRQIEGFKDGLNVMYGRNEVGKTTLLDFIRFTLFGYPRTIAARRPPINGGNHGGRLWLRNSANEPLTLHRKGNSKSIELDYRGETITQENMLLRLMNNASSDLYNNVYAITVDELMGIDKLNSSGMEDRIFSMGMGLAGIDYGAFEKGLIDHAEEYFITRGQVQILPKIVAQLEEKQEKIAVLQQKLSEFNRLTEEAKSSEKAIAQLNEERQQLHREYTKLKNFVKAYEFYIHYTSASEIIAASPAISPHPKELVDDYKSLKLQRDQEQNKLNETQSTAEQVKQRLTAIQLDETLPKDEVNLHFFKSNVKVYEQALISLKDLNEKKNALLSDKSFILKNLGENYTEEQLLQLTGTFELRSFTTDFNEKMSEVVRKTDQQAHTVRQAQQAVENAKSQLELLLEDRKKKGLDKDNAREELQNKRALLDTAFKKVLAGKTSSVSTNNTTKTLGLIAALAVVIAAVVVWPTSVLLSIILGVVGIGVGLLILLNKKGNASTLPADTTDANALNAELIATTELLSQLEQLNQKIKDATLTLNNLERKLHAEEQLLSTLNEEQTTLDKEWTATLVNHQLPETIRARGMNDFLSQVEELKRIHQAILETETTIQRFDETKTTFENKAQQLDKNIHITDLQEIYHLINRLEQNAQNSKALDALTAELAVIQENATHTERVVKEHEANIQQIWKTVEVADETAFYAYFQETEKVQKALELKESAAATIRSICGIDLLDETIQELSTVEPSELEVNAQLAFENYTAANTQFEEKTNALATLNAEIKHILEPDEMFQLQNEKESLEAELQEEFKEWMATKVALKVLSESKQRYEEEHQPEVITFTREYFKAITENAYTDLRISLSERHVSLTHKSGKVKTVDELSRGTKEQLLLALRLGLIEEYEKNSEPLPVALDDVMVNFDVHRSANLAQVLNKFAKDRQVILFTCHEHTAELMKHVGGNVIEWE